MARVAREGKITIMINGWYRDMDKIAEYYAARRDPDGPHEVPGMPPCICSRCVTRRAGEQDADRAIEQAEADAEAIGRQVEQAQFITNETEPCEPVYGVTGPAVSAGGPGIFGVVAVRTPAPEPEPEDEAAVMWRSFWEPVFLSREELDRLAPSRPPGSCSGCGLPAVKGKLMCWYCATLDEITRQDSREPLRPAPPPVLLVGRREYPVASPAGTAQADRKMRRAATRPARPARKTRVVPVVLLLTGMAVIYAVVLAGLPNVLGFLGIAIILRALFLAVR